MSDDRKKPGSPTKRPSAPADEDVGYCRPPRSYQFRPGQSGNPRGRPRRDPSPGDAYLQVSKMPVIATESGRKRRISTEKAIYMKIRRGALEGDHKMIRQWLELGAKYAPEQAATGFRDLFDEDLRLLDEMKREAAAGPPTDPADKVRDDDADES